MKSALRIGRIGPVIFDFHYTWLLVLVPGLWWLALLWLPDTFPGHRSILYWTIAVAVMLLFMGSVALHEVVHALFAGTRRRNALLYPYGAAMPYTEEDMHSRSGMTVVASLAGPAFNLVVGALLVVISGASMATLPAGWADAVRGLTGPLGWLNIGLGAINLLPGIPFDGGWTIAAGINWFSGDHESGIRLGRFIGELIIPVMALLGLWKGIVDGDALVSLGLLALAWMAWVGEQQGKEQSLLQGAFEELAVDEVMDPVAAPDEVQDEDTVAHMVASHIHYEPDEPLPVLDSRRQLVGVVTVSAADELLQGRWASTSVTAVMEPLPEVEALDPGATLSDALRVIEMRGGELSEQKPIPVIQSGRFLGTIHPDKIEGFERADLELSDGVPEPEMHGSGEWMRKRMSPLLFAALLVAALALIGSIIFNANPYNLRSTKVTSSQPVVFSNFSPQKDSVVSGDSPAISVEMVGARAITTAQISLDGQFIDTFLTSDRLNDRRASAQVLQLPTGTHTITVVAVTANGQMEIAQWQFSTVSETVPGTTPNNQDPQPDGTPAPVNNGQTSKPSPGWRDQS